MAKGQAPNPVGPGEEVRGTDELGAWLAKDRALCGRKTGIMAKIAELERFLACVYSSVVIAV